jgi:hypothetical protein
MRHLQRRLAAAVLSVGALAQLATSSLTGLAAHDPDDLDAVFSAGDELELAFSPARAPPLPDVASPAAIATVVRFSQSIGRNHTGRWVLASDSAAAPSAAGSARALVLTVTDAAGHGVAQLYGPTNAKVEPRLTASELDGAGAVVSISPVVVGNFGTARGPRLVTIVYDGLLLGSNASSTATATLGFDVATNMPGPANGTAFASFVDFRVDRNGGSDRNRLSLRPALLRIRAGAWTDARTLRVEIETTDPAETKITAGSLFPVVLGHVRDAAQIRFYGTFDPTVQTDLAALQISGRFGNERTTVVSEEDPEDVELFMMLVVAFGGLLFCVVCGGGCAFIVKRRNKRDAARDAASGAGGGGGARRGGAGGRGDDDGAALPVLGAELSWVQPRGRPGVASDRPRDPIAPGDDSSLNLNSGGNRERERKRTGRKAGAGPAPRGGAPPDDTNPINSNSHNDNRHGREDRFPGAGVNDESVISVHLDDDGPAVGWSDNDNSDPDGSWDRRSGSHGRGNDSPRLAEYDRARGDNGDDRWSSDRSGSF